MNLATCFLNLERSRSEFYGSKLLPFILNAHLSICIKTELINDVSQRDKLTFADVLSKWRLISLWRSSWIAIVQACIPCCMCHVWCWGCVGVEDAALIWIFSSGQREANGQSTKYNTFCCYQKLLYAQPSNPTGCHQLNECFWWPFSSSLPHLQTS